MSKKDIQARNAHTVEQPSTWLLSQRQKLKKICIITY